MKPELIEEEIINNMMLQFGKLKTAGTEYHSVIKSVTDNKSTPFENRDNNVLPAINIVDGDAELLDTFESGAPVADYIMNIDLNIILANDDTLYLRRLVADIRKIVFANVTWGGYSYNTQYIGINRDPVDQLGQRIAHAQMKLQIYYRLNK